MQHLHTVIFSKHFTVHCNSVNYVHMFKVLPIVYIHIYMCFNGQMIACMKVQSFPIMLRLNVFITLPKVLCFGLVSEKYTGKPLVTLFWLCLDYANKLVPQEKRRVSHSVSYYSDGNSQSQPGNGESQIAISSSSKRDKCTFPKDTPYQWRIIHSQRNDAPVQTQATSRHVISTNRQTPVLQDMLNVPALDRCLMVLGWAGRPG